MMELTENFDRGDPPDALNGSVKRRVLVERKISPRGVVVGQIGLEDSAKMGFSNDHDVVETFPSDRSNNSLGMAVLPRRPRCGWTVTDPHRA